jgi:O-antigen/teichoic acid export membrane protein
LSFPQFSALFLSQLLALTIIVQPVKNVLDSAITAQAQTKYYYFLTGTMQVTKLALSVSLIPLFGLPGAIAGLILHDAIAALIYWFTFRRAYARPLVA